MSIWTSECVSSGHPDKVADQVSDAVLDAYISRDPDAMVACETLIKGDTIVLAGEITANTVVDIESLARQVVTSIGYDSEDVGFDASNCQVLNLVSAQSPQIHSAVNGDALGAGDQGLMFGYATDCTSNFMPPAIHFARKLIDAYEAVRAENSMYRPDAKAQITLSDGWNRVSTAILSFQHSEELDSHEAEVDAFERDILTRFMAMIRYSELGMFEDTEWKINTGGVWTLGGPAADAGVTGRKIVVDNYGADCPVGGGAFSGKDPSKVDRSAAYAARQVAKAIVQEGIAKTARVQIAYAIGEEYPVSVLPEIIEWKGSVGKADLLARQFVKDFDLRPGAIIERLDLRRPIYQETARIGHFGRDHYTWEQTK